MKDSANEPLAARLKQAREARDWSLAELAQRSGVSKAMLSRIERGECSPTASLLGRLSGALQLTMSQLFAPTQAPTGYVAERARQPTWRDPETGFIRRSMTPPGGPLTPLELVASDLPPGAAIAYPAAAYAFTQDHQIVVLEGALTVTRGGTVTVLQPGDCIRLAEPADCEYRNDGSNPCRYIVAVLRQGAP